MEQRYLQNLIDLATKELESYSLFAQDFGLINTLFIKKIFDDNNSHLFIQLRETKKLYLSIIVASFILMYEKNYNLQNAKEFNVGDIICDKKDKRSYQIEEKNININGTLDYGYKLSYKYIEKQLNKYENKNFSQGNRYIPSAQFRCNNYIKIIDHTHKKYDFSKLLSFLKKHLNIEEVLADLPYKIAIVCHKQELIKDLRNTDWHKAIPYRYLTKDGQKEDNLPIEPLIYIASDYQTIREHIFDKGEKLEAVIFFDKYSNCEIIIKDIREGQLKKSIFIGEDDLQFKHNDLLKWRWTPKECHYFYPDDLPVAKILPIYVENLQLSVSIDKFIRDIEEIEQQYTVSFSSLKYYTKIALLTVIPEFDGLQILQEKFTTECEEVLFNELYTAGVAKKDIDLYAKIFQDSYHDVIKQIQFANNTKAKKIETLDYDYLIVSIEHKDIWQQKIPNKDVLTYAEWKINKGKNKNCLFLGLYGYSHYRAMKNSYDNISILIYNNSSEQKSFEYYRDRYNYELEDEYHSEDRKNLSGVSYSLPKKERTADIIMPFDETKNYGDTIEKQRDSQREDVFLKFIFNDGTFEILPISRHVLIQQGELLISEKLENVKLGDELGIYHNFNKDKLEDIATSKQRQDILDCKKCVKLWKEPLIKFYRSKNNYTKEKLLFDLQYKGADISHTNTLNKWLDMNDKTLFPSKSKNIIAIGELLGDDDFKENLKEISKKRKLYRSIMITLGRDFSDAISQYIISKERTNLLRNFSNEQIENMLKENIKFKKLVKIVEPNSKEKIEQESLIFEDDSLIASNENQPLTQKEENMTNEEFQALVQESEDLVEQAKEQADSLDEGINDLKSDISSKLDTVIQENVRLQEQVSQLTVRLQDAEEKIDALATMQKKHHEAIKYLLDSFKKLNAKIDHLKNTLK